MTCISHWGLVPGWFEPVPAPDGSYPMSWMGRPAPVCWCPVPFDQYCAVLDSVEQRELAMTMREPGTRH